MADDKNKQIDLEKATKIVEETCDPEILEDDDSLTEDEKYIRESAWLLLQELEGEDEDEEEDDDEDEEEEEDSEESSEDSSDTSSTTTEAGAETSTISDIVAEQGISTVGTVLAQVQSLGAAGIIAMSSALYFQGTAVVDNAVPLYDDINFQIEDIMEQEAMNIAINMAVDQQIQNAMSQEPVVASEDEESDEESAEEEKEEKSDDKKEDNKKKSKKSNVDDDEDSEDEEEEESEEEAEEEEKEEKPKKKGFLKKLFGGEVRRRGRRGRGRRV